MEPSLLPGCVHREGRPSVFGIGRKNSYQALTLAVAVLVAILVALHDVGLQLEHAPETVLAAPTSPRRYGSAAAAPPTRGGDGGGDTGRRMDSTCSSGSSSRSATTAFTREYRYYE